MAWSYFSALRSGAKGLPDGRNVYFSDDISS
jgi:hypothetical protein